MGKGSFSAVSGYSPALRVSQSLNLSSWSHHIHSQEQTEGKAAMPPARLASSQLAFFTLKQSGSSP